MLYALASRSWRVFHGLRAGFAIRQGQRQRCPQCEPSACHGHGEFRMASSVARSRWCACQSPERSRQARVPAKGLLKVGAGRLGSVVARAEEVEEKAEETGVMRGTDYQRHCELRLTARARFRCQRERCTATANCLEWFSSFQFLKL